MIVLIGGEKGGTGKTTLATNLAAQHALAGHDVLLVDADPQGSASNWVHVRDEADITPRVACVQKLGKDLQAEIKDLAGRCENIIIDAGGRGDSVELRAGLVVAEKVLIPLQASQFDMWTLARMNELVATATGVNPVLRAFVVICRASPNPRVSEAAEAMPVLADYEHLEMAATVIYDRIVYRRSSREGVSVSELSPPNKKAITELNDLYEEIFNNRQTVEKSNLGRWVDAKAIR